MKNNYIFLFLFFMLYTTLSFSQTVTVSGGGCSQSHCFGGNISVDGDYSSVNIVSGRHIFVHNGHGGTQVKFQNGRWEITDCVNGTLFTNTNATSPFPPAAGWSNGVNICSGESAPTLSGSVVLPVELSEFTVKSVNFQIALNWQTATETNNAGFEVQRSTDGKNFQNLTFIEGKGTTSEVQDYVYDDQDLKKGQLYHYRLKQIDYDGAFEYSKTITARLEADGIVGTFSPNPSVGGQTVLDYTAPTTGDLMLRVFDVSGRELLQQQYEVRKGGNTLAVDFASLGKGLFFVKMEQGELSAYEKVMVK